MKARIKEGYGMVQRDVMIDESISIFSKAVYCLIVSYTGDKQYCYPSLQTMCKNLQVSKPTIIKSLKELIANGFIKANKRRTKEGEHATNIYFPMFIMEENVVNEVDLVNESGKSQLLLIVNDVDNKNNTIKNNISFTKKVKEGKSKFIKPTLQEVKDYFEEKGYSTDIAKKAFEYYDTANWKDSGGKPVLNWKQKMISNWFKDSNKVIIDSQERIKF